MNLLWYLLKVFGKKLLKRESLNSLGNISENYLHIFVSKIGLKLKILLKSLKKNLTKMMINHSKFILIFLKRL